MAQMVKDPLLRTSRVRPCMVVEVVRACLVHLHHTSLNRYADTLLQREKYVPRRGSYSLLRDCYKETRGLDVSFWLISINVGF